MEAQEQRAAKEAVQAKQQRTKQSAEEEKCLQPQDFQVLLSQAKYQFHPNHWHAQGLFAAIKENHYHTELECTATVVTQGIAAVASG